MAYIIYRTAVIASPSAATGWIAKKDEPRDSHGHVYPGDRRDLRRLLVGPAGVKQMRHFLSDVQTGPNGRLMVSRTTDVTVAAHFTPADATALAAELQRDGWRTSVV